MDTGLTWPEVLGGLAAGLTIVSLLAAGLAWFVRVQIRQAAEPARRAAAQTATSNGRRLGQLAESTESKVTELQTALTTRVDALERRFDRHLLNDHQGG